MRILVISHPTFNIQNNMGKTLSSLLSSFCKDDICQLYVQPMIPNVDRSKSYYCITDTDALKSILQVKESHIGKTFSYEQVNCIHRSSNVTAKWKRNIYSFGRKRTPLIYIARNTIWRLSKWYSEDLKQWIRDFAPDVIFFASGDYKFAYEITYTISRDFDIPIILYCCDDYYINRLNPQSFLGRPVHRSLMHSVQKCVSRSVGIITICDQMADAYRKLFDKFDKPVYTVYTGSSTTGERNPDGQGIVYLGNLGLSRHKSLIDIGQALKRISDRTGRKLHLDVYSAETREEILKDLTEENGILFHGAVDSQEVNRIISESLLVVHTESFEPKNIHKVQYSISTKIADLLASGHCILAYGPENVASIEYLKQNHAACVISDKKILEKELELILFDRSRREAIIQSAGELAKRNHNGQMVSQRIQEIVREFF